MTPGAYLRLRREAAGLTIADVARIVSDVTPLAGADGRRWTRLNRNLLHATEVGDTTPGPHFADRLRQAFAFDRFVLRQLIGRLDPVPEICRTCGCSALDACDDDVVGPCAWANAVHDLCTRCAGDPARATPEETRHA